jgi:hypothetical protein
MCGIVGVITKEANGFKYPQMDLFDEMLITDAIRGMDSTGVFSVNKSGNAHYVKLAAHPFALFKTKEYITWRQDLWHIGKAIIGHNRKATTGSINNDNAHPFAFGPIMLVHNGYIENFRSLVHNRERDKHGINVDSHAVAVLLAREPDPLKVIPELRGAFVLVWYNTKTKLMHFVRNTERPLSFCEGADGVYFASERGMLSWLLKRRNNQATIAELKPGTLLSINIEDGKWETKDVKVYEKDVKVYTTPSASAERRPVVTVDENGVIQRTPAANVTPLPQKFADVPILERFNIHYGDDKVINTDKVTYPQIVFRCEDFRRVSEDHVYLPVWKLWGPALNSNNIEIHCQFRGTEEDANKLAYEDYLVARIMRTGEKTIDGKIVQVAFCCEPRVAKMIATPNKLPITEEHLTFMQRVKKCTCNSVDIDTIANEDQIYMRDGFVTSMTCKWCIEGTDLCQKHCAEPGKCEYCLKEPNEKTADTSVQAGK